VTKVVLDTSVYIDWLNRGLHDELLLGQGYVRYLSAVVAMELRVGAATRPAQRAIEQLVRAYRASRRMVAPGSQVFDSAADILRRLMRDGHEIRRASLVNDVLIALTARSLGATVVSANASDFEAIYKTHHFSLRIVGS